MTTNRLLQGYLYLLTLGVTIDEGTINILFAILVAVCSFRYAFVVVITCILEWGVPLFSASVTHVEISIFVPQYVLC
jgi:hypothetical protein